MRAFRDEHATPGNPLYLFDPALAGSASPPADAWEIWWSQTGKADLARLLAHEWDPIFRGMRIAAQEDEYTDFAEKLGPILRAGATRQALAEFLYRSEEQMHLHPDNTDRERDQRVAAAIVAWYERSEPLG